MWVHGFMASCLHKLQLKLQTRAPCIIPVSIVEANLIYDRKHHDVPQHDPDGGELVRVSRAAHVLLDGVDDDRHREVDDCRQHECVLTAIPHLGAVHLNIKGTTTLPR